LVSQINAIIFVVIALVAFLVSAGTLFPKRGLQNYGLTILSVSVLVFVVYVLWQVFVTGRTIWTIDENGVKIVWTKKFFLGGSYDDLIRWSEIKNIRRGSDPQYYTLKIEHVSGYTIKYFHDTLTTKDDFDKMLKTLYKTFNDKKASAFTKEG